MPAEDTKDLVIAIKIKADFYYCGEPTIALFMNDVSAKMDEKINNMRDQEHMIK